MKSMSSRMGTFASVLLIGAAAALYGLTTSSVDGQFRTAISNARMLQQLGAEWGKATSRVRADPGAHFDGLAEFVPRMRKMKSEFSQSLARIPDLPDHVTSNARAYLATLDSLRERVERFKTAYAVIRNSQRYLPVASSVLVRRAHEFDDDEVAREARDLATELNRVLASPEAVRKEHLRERLREFADEAAGKPATLGVAISTFASHAAVLLDKYGRAEELFQGVASNTVSERVKPLADALLAEQENRHRMATLYRQGALALLAGVLVLWIAIWIASRVARSSRDAEVAVDRKRSADCLRGAGADSRDSESQALEARAKLGDSAERDLIEMLEVTGTLAGLIGEGIESCALRIRQDVNAIRRKSAETPDSGPVEEVMQLCSRLLGDTGRLRLVARRLTILASRRTPKDVGSIDVNECLDEVLNELDVQDSCAVERSLGELPRVHASRSGVRLILFICVESVLHALRNIDPSVATLKVSTASDSDRVTISLVHSARRPLPGQHPGLFMPFGPHEDPRAGLALPSAFYLARKYQGKVRISATQDKRSAITVQLPVHPNTNSHVSLPHHALERGKTAEVCRDSMCNGSLAREKFGTLRDMGDPPGEPDPLRPTAQGLGG